MRTRKYSEQEIDGQRIAVSDYMRAHELFNKDGDESSAQVAFGMAQGAQERLNQMASSREKKA